MPFNGSANFCLFYRCNFWSDQCFLQRCERVFVNLYEYLVLDDAYSWVPSIAPQWLQNFQSGLNPYFWFLEEYREIFLYGNESQLEKILFLALASSLVFAESFSLSSIWRRKFEIIFDSRKYHFVKRKKFK